MSFMSRRRDKRIRVTYLMIGRLKEEIQKAERCQPYELALLRCRRSVAV